MKNLHNRWTTAKLINLSQKLGNAYCPGLEQTKSENNGWTTARLLQMSASLAHGYHLGL